jgi:hypothetical protein
MFCWNGCLAFYQENYLVLSCIGWIGMYDLRFGKVYSATENFSSLLSIILLSFSIAFPLFIACFNLINFKPLLKPIQLEPGVTIEEKSAVMRKRYGSVDAYNSMFHTKIQRKVFIEKYGEWTRSLNIFRLGHKKAVLIPLADLIH